MKSIEHFTEQEVQEIALDQTIIKGYTCYFAELNSNFGYSVIVFKNGKMIHFANDYQLYHSSVKSKIELKKYYLRNLDSKLFTDQELAGPVANYKDYKSKSYFIRNLMPQQYDYLTGWAINGKYTDSEDIKKEESGLYTNFSYIAFAYFKDNQFQDRATPLLDNLEKEYKLLLQKKEAFKEAIHEELIEHEAGFTGEYMEALENLGLTYDSLTKGQRKIVLKERDCLYQSR